MLSMKVGQSVIIRTVTYHYIGQVEAVTADEVSLGDASWLACSKRWADTLRTGEVAELEPYPQGCHVATGAIVDWSEWLHPLPTEQV